VRQLGLHPADDLPATAQPHSGTGLEEDGPSILPGEQIAARLGPMAGSRRHGAGDGASPGSRSTVGFNLHTWFDSVLMADDVSPLWQRVAPAAEAAAQPDMFFHGVAPHSSQLLPNVPLPALANAVLAQVATRPLPAPLAACIEGALEAACYSRAAAIAASHGAPRAACRVLQVHAAWLSAQARSLKEAAAAAEHLGLSKQCVSALQQQSAVLQLASDQRTRASDHVAEFAAQFAAAQGVASKFRDAAAAVEALNAEDGADQAAARAGSSGNRPRVFDTRPQLEALRRWSVKCAVHARSVASISPWLAALSWLLRGQVLAVLPPGAVRIAAGVS